MTTQSYKQPTPETASELFNIHESFNDQGKRLLDVLNRLVNIGNKLSDDSGMEKICGAEPKLERQPGIIANLYNEIDGFRSLNNNLETVVSKLEKFI